MAAPDLFTSPQELNNLGLTKYTRLRGLAYQLVPVENPNPAADAVDNDAAYKRSWKNLPMAAPARPVSTTTKRTDATSIPSNSPAQMAESLVAEAGKKDSARKLLEHFDQNVLQSNFPYGMTSNQSNLHDYFSFRFLEACYTQPKTGPLPKK
jgi:hypothetical protein